MVPNLRGTSLNAGAQLRRWVAEGNRTVSIIGWIIIGALAGWLASKVANTDAEMGWLANIVVGIVGALVGGFLMGILTDADFTAEFNIGTLIVAFVGALVVLFGYRAVTSRG